MGILSLNQTINNGTSQNERLPQALCEDYLKLDPRTWEDLLQQSALFAKNLTFYNLNSEQDGDWKSFFSDIYDYENDKLKKDWLVRQMKDSKLPPHIALLLSFFRLFRIQQDNLNTITERHLLFYYQDVLGFSLKKGYVGNSIVFLEIKNNQNEVFLPKGTVFNAGKDKYGKPISYVSKDDSVINRAKVNSLAFFSADGGCEPLTNLKEPMSLEFENFGFAIASKSFEIIEGFSINNVDAIDFNNFNISFTGKDGWITSSIDKDGGIAIEEGRIVAYNKKIHGYAFDTQYPIIMFSAKKIEYVRDCKIDISNIMITVKNSKDVLIRNSFGVFPNEVGVMVYGPLCEKGSTFCIESTQGEITDVDPLVLLCGKKTCEKNYEYSLDSDDYNQIQYGVKLAKYLIDYQKGKENDKPLPDPIHPIVLTDPIRVTYKKSLSDLDTQIYPFTPFGLSGYKEVSFPQIRKNEKDTEAEVQDSFLIGMSDVSFATSVSIYFHINPFKNDTNVSSTPKWFFLKENEWVGIKSLLKDSTDGLKKSGVVRLKISEDMLSPHMSMPQNPLWIKVSYEAKTFDFSAIEDVRTQAVEVAYDENSIGEIVSGEILPANSITKLMDNYSEIKKIEQPYDGEIGYPDESMLKFKCRVSEKLRHKGKAWTCWDYERLVLENFPTIATVKCLANMDEEGNVKAGHVLLLVIPDFQKVHQQNFLRPEVGENIRLDIRKYIEETVASPFVSVHVCSPKYIGLNVSTCIALKRNLDDWSYYQSIINEALEKFIAPWSDNSSNAVFSKVKSESDILSFLEGLDCVDFVKSIAIEEEPSSYNSELVIYTSGSHTINKLENED